MIDIDKAIKQRIEELKNGDMFIDRVGGFCIRAYNTKSNDINDSNWVYEIIRHKGGTVAKGRSKNAKAKTEIIDEDTLIKCIERHLKKDDKCYC